MKKIDLNLYLSFAGAAGRLFRWTSDIGGGKFSRLAPLVAK